MARTTPVQDTSRQFRLAVTCQARQHVKFGRRRKQMAVWLSLQITGPAESSEFAWQGSTSSVRLTNDDLASRTNFNKGQKSNHGESCSLCFRLYLLQVPTVE
jgi:hypothetical protein